MIPDILNTAALFAGEPLGAGEEMVLEGFCTEALTQWSRRLKETVTPEDCRTALIPACALTALAGFLTGREGAAVPLSFTAGEVSLRQETGEAEHRLRQLREEAARLMVPYVGDGDFHFRGVRG